MARINELIGTGTADLVKKDDLATLQKLQAEFSAELTNLRGRVDTLEAHTATLAANQFSTTTKLQGQVIISVNAGGFNGNRIIDPTGRVLATTNPNPTLVSRTGIDLNTSFTGTDLLKLRLETGNTGNAYNAGYVLEPNFGSSLDYAINPPTTGQIATGRIFYTFRPTADLSVSLGPDIRTTDYVDFNSYAKLSFLDFSTQAFVNNYILFPVSGPASGAAIDWKPGNGAISVRGLYAAANAANPGESGVLIAAAPFIALLYPQAFNPNTVSKQGLFGSTYQGTVELEYAPSRTWAIRLEYSGGRSPRSRL